MRPHLALALALPLAACGGSSSSSSGATGFALTSANPADQATDVPREQPLVLTFTQDVDAATAAAGLVLQANATPLTPSLTTNGNTLTVTTSRGTWETGTTYTVGITDDLRSTNGSTAVVGTLSFSTETFSSATAANATVPGSTSRAAAVSVTLTDGRILTAGGTFTTPVAAADIYDPEAQTLTATGSLTTGRWGHQLTVLPDGRVLASGGLGITGASLSSLELYDPVRGTWRTLPATLDAGRAFHEALVLKDGRVAILGGRDDFTHSTANPNTTLELFDPQDETVTLVNGTTLTPNVEWIPLLDRRVLELGPTSRVWDFTATPPTSQTTTNQTAQARLDTGNVILPDGTVFIAGGLSGFTTSSQIHDQVETFDPTNLTFTSLPPLSLPRFLPVALLLADHRVAVVGGGTPNLMGPPNSADLIELYDPSNGDIEAVTTLAYDFVSAASLPQGGLVITSSRTSHVDPTQARDTVAVFGPDDLAPPSNLHVEALRTLGRSDRHHPAGVLEVRFSQTVSAASLQASSFLLSPGAISLAVDPTSDGLGAILRPTTPLTPNTTYSLTTTNAVLAQGGAALDTTLGANPATFTTAPATQLGQGSMIVIDRSGDDRVLRFVDLNQDGDFDDADEATELVTLPGTTLQSPITSPRGVIFVPDSGMDVLHRLQDLNGDGDCADAGEATIAFDNTSPLGSILTSPASAALAPDGTLYLADNGSGGGTDEILRLQDLNGDGDFLDANEAAVFNDTDYSGALWDLAVDLDGTLWHTVTGSSRELYRHRDLNGDGDSLDTDERVLFATITEFGTDVTFSAGGAPIVWTSLTTPGATRYDRSATPTVVFSDPGTLVGSGTFSLSMFSGQTYRFAENGSAQIYRLEDMNLDGDYDDAGEQVLEFANGSSILDDCDYSTAGYAPAAPRWDPLPTAGQLTVSGLAAPNTPVRVTAAGVLFTTTSDASGNWSVTLSTALAVSDLVQARTLTLGGLSPAQTWQVR